MFYGFLADLIVAVHIAYVSYVLVGEVLILLGMAFGWSWIRNPWFRWSHLAAIAVVAAEALAGISCPLTDLEDHLRGLAGQQVSDVSFIGRFLDGVLFYEVPQRILNLCYVGFALLVLTTFLLAPPRSGDGDLACAPKA